MTASPTGSPQRKPRRRWRWHVPPALVHGNETLEGTEMLEEVPGAVGVVLWQTMRDVTLWSGTREPEERTNLFAAGAHERRLRELEAAGVDAAIDAPLRALAGICRAPAETTEAEILTACREISQWAEDRDLLATAIAFAQAGALAAPTNAAAGYKVGRLARRKAENARAESWFRRVIGLGRQAKDWASYAEAFLGLGNLYIQRGNFPAARRFLIRALRAARRHGLREIQARALHDLFGIAVNSGNAAEAQEFARAAFRAYGSTHPRLPALAHDIGYFWMTQGRFSHALAVFQAILPHISRSSDLILAHGDIGRAAGGVGNREVFDRAWDEVWNQAGDWHKKPGAAQGLLDLARGAGSLKDWVRAEKAAQAARDIAQRREENRVVLETDTVLDSVSRRRAVETAPAGTMDEADAAGLAADLLRSLSGSAAAGV
ncbi:MAG TPA: tetratricopeptide repeat protein [Longimicrobium sp.]|nr:tetratricopeptide repeat protein [Longimicrobium sp.]